MASFIDSNEFLKISVEILPWFGLGFLDSMLPQKAFLLVVGGCPSLVGRACTYLVGRYDGDDMLIFTNEFDPRPAGKIIASFTFDAANEIAMRQDKSSSGLVELISWDIASGGLDTMMGE
jgi:hypothetical protein